MIQITIESRPGGPRPVVYAEGVEIDIVNAKIHWDPENRYIPDGRVRVTIDCFATLVQTENEETNEKPTN